MTSPVPLTLRTERLLLRPWRAEDAPALLPILEANRAHLEPWIPERVAKPAPAAELAARLAGFAADFAAARAWRYAVFAPDESRILGEVDLFPRSDDGRVALPDADRVEIGYWLDAAATGRGLATEAVRTMLSLGAALPGITRAEIHCDPTNVASAAVPRRLGFALAFADQESQIWSMPLIAPHAVAR